MKISIKGYITSKESELFLDCADRYAINNTHHKFAISDGVSKSFFPKFWAEILVDNFVKSKEIDDNTFVQKCQEEWLTKVTEIVKRPDVKWFTTNAFNNKRPGLATFVGLRFFPKGKELRWKANALGDSFLFFVPKTTKDFEKDCIKLSSKTDLIFDNFPDYLSSIGESHKGAKQPLEDVLVEGTFYLMTDALAEWFVNEKEDAIGKIDVWKNQKEFERFVNEERISKKLGNDDSAILIIEVVDDKKTKITYSEISVSNINDLESIQKEEIKNAKKIDDDNKKKLEEAEDLKEKENGNSKEQLKKVNKIAETNALNETQEGASLTNPELTEEKDCAEVEKSTEIQENISKIESLSAEQKEQKTGLLEKGKEFIFGKKEEETKGTAENLEHSQEKNNELVSEGENQVENTKEEVTTNHKQEITPKEVEKTVQKKNKKGNTPSKLNITNKF